MKTKIKLVVAMFASLIFAAHGQENIVVGKTMFKDMFTGSRMSDSRWYIPTWVSSTDGTYVGRTQFRTSQNSPLPITKNGYARIALDTYNPTGYSLYGTDLILKKKLMPTEKGILVTVVAKMPRPIPKGVVAGIFLYALKPGSNTLHDEIDFELLGNTPRRVHTNIYANEPLGVGRPMSYPMSSSIASWHTYQILWSTQEVSWYVDQKLIRTVLKTEAPIPVGPMYLHINMWAPGTEWSDAYNATLQPVSSPALNKTYHLLVDSVTVQKLN